MLIRKPRPWEVPEHSATPEGVYRDRRRFLALLAGGAGAALLGGRALAGRLAGPEPVSDPLAPLSARRNPRFSPDVTLTSEAAATRYNNFYEFSQGKDVWRFVDEFEPRPWTVEVTGLVDKPRVWDLDELMRLGLEERVYRFRCVEAWYMDIPWVGFPLRKLIEASQPRAAARFVRFVSVLRPDQMPGQKQFTWYRWPYYEGLSLAEATNELTLGTLGVYGKVLPNQNGAPFRVVVPWKYGYKGPKSVVRVELVSKRPHTFWNDLQPDEYSFDSNVNPEVPHPRWSQAHERSIDGRADRPTLLYNGYGEWVGGLYS